MSFCSKCGANIYEGDSFCMQCGTPVEQKPDINPVPDDGIVINTSIVNPLKEKADAGDSIAMFNLGQYYDTLDNEKLINGVRPHRIALDWFQKAAEAGHAGGTAKMCYHYSMLAILDDLKCDLDDQECALRQMNLYLMFVEGMHLIQANAPGSELVNIDQFVDKTYEAQYRAACALYFAHDDERAKILVRDTKDTPSRILEAILMHDDPDRTNESIFESIKRMGIIIDNEEYGKKEKSLKEELLYTMAAWDLEEYYRIVDDNNELGLGILNQIRSYLKNDKVITLMDQRRSHYSVLESGQVVYTDND